MWFETIGTPAAWAGFLLLVLAMLAIDLGVFHRREHVVSLKEAACWSAVWVGLASAFAVLIYWWYGVDRALEYTTGYLLEKALAIDNIFVFVVIFSAFGIPALYQHRVLYWGVLGALVLRAGFILAGGAFVQRFHWAMYVFGAILAFTGLKLLFAGSEEVHPEKNPVVKLFQRFFPVTSTLEGHHFFVRRAGRSYATPLFIALLAVEVSDVVFAVDSIPAIFAITTDPFIVFTSNIFAILGLRSLFFLLAGVVDKFVYLKTGLSVVLLFVAAKMLLVDVYKVPILVSLGVIASTLAVSILASILKPPAARRARAREV